MPNTKLSVLGNALREGSRRLILAVTVPLIVPIMCLFLLMMAALLSMTCVALAPLLTYRVLIPPRHLSPIEKANKLLEKMTAGRR